MKNAKTFALGTKKLHLVFLTTVGSRLHKLNLHNSDVDLKGVFVWDRTAMAGLKTMNDTLDCKNTDANEWADLMTQLNNEFGLELAPTDDLELWTAKKFFLTALKNDFNMLDMLFSKLEPKFKADVFQPVLDNKTSFLNMRQADTRFSGMARGALHEAKKLLGKENPTNKEKNDLKKNLAKSLQFLFSLDNLFKTQTHNPVLPKEQRLEVLNAKKGLTPFEAVSDRHAELTLALEDTRANESLLEKKDDREKLNTLLENLTLLTQ